MPLLSFEGVTKHFRHDGRGGVVLDDVWLDVEAGEHVGVWAERRAGKSTLLRLAAGLELPDMGTVRFASQDLARLPRLGRTRLLRDEIGFVPTALDSSDERRGMRVAEYVAVPLLAGSWRGRDAVALARSVLERVGAAHCADLLLPALSLGERTRVAIARGLIREPRLLLVDEPAATPSPGEQDEIRGLLRSIGSASGRTLVVASEEPAVLRGASRVVSLSDGRLLTSDRRGTVVAFPDVEHRRESPAS